MWNNVSSINNFRPSVLNTSIQTAIVELLVKHADWFFVEGKFTLFSIPS